MISLGSNWVHYSLRLARILRNASDNLMQFLLYLFFYFYYTYFFTLYKRNVQCIKYKNDVDFHCVSPYPPRFPLQSHYRMEAFSYAAPVPSQKYTGCTFNFSSKDSENSPLQPQKNDFRYIKFIYLHCGEETNLRDPRS